MQSVTPQGKDKPCCAVLTDGMIASAYFEHAFLAHSMGIPLLEGEDLYVENKKVNQQSIGRREALYFLAFNPDFPRSIVYNFYAIQKISQEIGFYGQEEKDTMVRQLRSLMKNFNHQNERDAKEVLFLKDTLKALQELSDILERKYLEVIS